MAIKSTTLIKTLQRGSVHNLECSFFQDDAFTVPMISYDLTQWPAYNIYDISNNIVSTGVAQQLSPGNFRCLWNIRQDALLSNDSRKYRIEWYFKDTNKNQFSFSQEFDVVDTEIVTSENPEQLLYTLKDKKYRFKIKTQIKPYDITLEIYKGTNDQTPIIKDLSLKGNDIKCIESDIWFTYYYEVEEGVLDTVCGYTALWGVQEYETTDTYYETQTVQVIPVTLMQFITKLRGLIDKLQKKMGTIQAYQDSDCIDYLQHGLEVVNMIQPVTYYTTQTLPEPLQVAWLIASGWYALNAQHLLEVELSFNFGGQSDTFEYNHEAGIGDTLSRFDEYLKGPVATAKTQLFRTSHKIGTAGVRVQSFRGRSNNIVFPISMQNGMPNTGNYLVFFSLS